MEFLRTPDNCFEGLPDYDFTPHYKQVSDQQGNRLRMHYIDQGLATAPVVLMLHGEPTWSYLYRKIIPQVVEAGFRVIAPDLIGFGRSDKPIQQQDYSYQRHIDWSWDLISQLELDGITLLCQDWGGLVGLRLVAEHPQYFCGVCAANTFLPTGDHQPGKAFEKWQAYSQSVDCFPAGNIVDRATTSGLSAHVIAAYDAPFPDERFKAAARAFPMLVPTHPDDPASEANRRAWQSLQSWRKPFITAFSDSDPITAGGDKIFQSLIPGCKGQAHTTIVNAGHFLQEDQSDKLTNVLLTFIQDNPTT